MTKSDKVVQALKLIRTYKYIEKEAGLGDKTISRIVNGKRKISEDQVDKLYPVLIELKMIKN